VYANLGRTCRWGASRPGHRSRSVGTTNATHVCRLSKLPGLRCSGHKPADVVLRRNGTVPIT
jgi:hypothetical protein